MFDTCPSQYYELYVAKSVPRTSNVYAEFGNYVHRAFENFLGQGIELPSDLKGHTDYLSKIRDRPGVFFVERKAAFNKQGEPVGWDWRKSEIWARFKIDYIKVDTDRDPPIAFVWDYKTGRRKDDFTQLIIYALYVFAAHPVDLVDVRYYWLQSKDETRKVWGRAEIPQLWDKLIPLLKQYRQAFRDDVWQKRKNRLCQGFCGVPSCEFWEPKRERR